MEAYSSQEMKRYNYLVGEINAVYHDISLKLGLSDSAMIVLYAICDHGDSCLLADICRCSGISKQTINSAIRKLEEEGMVYLETIGASRKKVCLTKEGKRLAARTAIRVIEAENAIFDSWTPEDVAQYLRLTERFLCAIQEKSKELCTEGAL